MFLTHNQPIMNLDHLVDTESLMAMKPFISAFVARNFHLLKPNKFISGNFDSGEKGIYDYFLEYKNNLHSLPENLQPVVQNLINNDLFGNWIVFEQDVATGNFLITLRYIGQSYQTKHLASQCVALPEDSQMQFFYDWLDGQQIFNQYGRVAMFVNFQHSVGKMHVDYYNSRDANHDEFIWIGFSAHKKLFVYDPTTQQKVYATGHCNWFNTGNWHGTDPVEQACYSIRIDGVFSQEFKRRMSQSTPD